MSPIKSAFIYCPKCKKKKHVARSYQAGYRVCHICKIKWSMKEPSKIIKLK